jgi:hypothetical protein
MSYEERVANRKLLENYSKLIAHNSKPVAHFTTFAGENFVGI